MDPHQFHGSEDPENPSFNLSLRAFLRRHDWLEKLMKLPFLICIPHPSGNRIAVVLIRRASLDGKVSSPKGRIHFRHNRASIWYFPAVERPEMDSPCCMTVNKQDPRKTRMRRFCHRSLHIKPKH